MLGPMRPTMLIALVLVCVAGCSRAAKDDAGKTALDYARELGRGDIADLITKRLSAPSSQRN